MGNSELSGGVTVTVPAQPALTKAQRAMLKEAYGEGQSVPAKVRFHCHIANAMNDSIADGIELGGHVYMPNPYVTAQFGKNARGNAYLTVGMIDYGPQGKSIGKPLTFTWEGDAVPVEMVRIAVSHDEGRTHPRARIRLDLAAADIYVTGSRNGVKRDPRRRHDLDKNGDVRPRPERAHHNRLCSEDLRQIKNLVGQLQG